jgi:tetratricopeptide (TPR) repeat protein
MPPSWKHSRRPVAWLFSVGLGVALSVGRPAPTQAQATPQKAITDADAASFAKAVETAYQNTDAKSFSDLLDWDALLDKATAGVDAPEQFRTTFRSGVLKSARDQNGFSRTFIQQSKAGVRFSMIRSRMRDAQKTALFRLGSSEGVNYVEFLLARDNLGKVRASDVYMFGVGEPTSATVHRVYLQAATQFNRGLLAKLAGNDQDFLNNFSKIKDISDNINDGKNAEALAISNALPESMKKDKSFLLVRIRVTQKLDVKLYTDAIDRYRELYPNDPAVDILSLDGFTLHKQYDKALDAIDRLDKSVDGDGYLNVMRSALLILAEKPEEARKAGKLGIEAEPKMVEGYWILLTAELRLNDYPAALATLKRIDQTFTLEFGDLATVPKYAGFAKSPQFKEWKEYLNSKKASAKPTP